VQTVKTQENRVMITIELPPQAESELENAAKEAGKSKEEWTRELILNYLEDLEDLREAEATMKDIREGREKTTPLEEVMKEYGLER
jgi:RHH-type rel operon transcriptional repressor/antitoxin RelB